MSVEQAEQMTEWLKSLSPDYQNIIPVRVEIGFEPKLLPFYGVKYVRVSGTSEVPWMELIGQRPIEIRRKRNFCFTHESGVWYIAYYHDKELSNSYHPFGKQFGMKIWDLNEPIDKYAKHPYLRVPMMIETLRQ